MEDRSGATCITLHLKLTGFGGACISFLRNSILYSHTFAALVTYNLRQIQTATLGVSH